MTERCRTESSRASSACIGTTAISAGSPQHVTWVRKLWERLEPHLQGNAYVNHLPADDRPEKVRASFGLNYARLRELKGEYDPTNLFRINANIAPAAMVPPAPRGGGPR
jgi:berberine-like enzyme